MANFTKMKLTFSRHRANTKAAPLGHRGASTPFPLGDFVWQPCLGSVWFTRHKMLFARKGVSWAGLMSKLAQLFF